MTLLPLGNPGPAAGAGLPSFLAEAPPFVLPFGITVPVDSAMQGTAAPLLAATAYPLAAEGKVAVQEATAPSRTEHEEQGSTAQIGSAPTLVLAAAIAPPPAAAPAITQMPLPAQPEQNSEASAEPRSGDEPETVAPQAHLAPTAEVLARPVLAPPFSPPPFGEPRPGDAPTGDSSAKMAAALSPWWPAQPTEPPTIADRPPEAEQGSAAPETPRSKHSEPPTSADAAQPQFRAPPPTPAGVATRTTATGPTSSPPDMMVSAAGIAARDAPHERLVAKPALISTQPLEANDNDNTAAPAPKEPIIPADRQSTPAPVKPPVRHEGESPAAPKLSPAREQTIAAEPATAEAQHAAAPAIAPTAAAPTSRPADQVAPAVPNPLTPAQQLAAPQSVPAAPAATPLPRLDITAPRFAEQVGIAITRRLGGLQPGDELVLQIEPAHLGRIRVELNFAPDGKLEALVTADQPRVLDLLKLHASDLHRALIEAGGRTDIAAPRFEPRQDSGTSVAPQSGSTPQNFASSGNGNGGNPAQSQHQPRTAFAYPADALPDSESPAQPLRLAAGRLDLIA